MRTSTRRWFSYILMAVLLASIGILYRHLPDQIPNHWNLNGQITYGSKSSIWLIGGMAVLFNILFEVMPAIDPRRKNYGKFQKEYNLFCAFLNLYLVAFAGAMLIQAFRPGAFSMPRFICAVLGVTFLVIGNMMPKFKSNFSSGIKTPWALSDEENWRKTHRLGGRLYFLSGIFWILSALLIKNMRLLFILNFSAIMAASTVPYLMSYLWWRQKERA